ncbi:hypothetical protein REPUB_Repub03eG0083200 [Reevesia pubescens]
MASEKGSERSQQEDDHLERSKFVEEIEIDSDDDMDEGVEDDIPTVKIASDMKKSLRNPWRLALIIKLLGKNITFNVLKNGITLLWKLSGDFELIDLGCGFYVVRFDNMEYRTKVMTGSTTVWIHLPELPLEYFNGDILREIGSLVRKPLKIDTNTALVTRGKFARICIEVDLQKPLVSKVRIGKHIQKIEYKGIHTVCFSCVVVGLGAEFCPSSLVEIKITKQQSNEHVLHDTTENSGSMMGNEDQKEAKDSRGDPTSSRPWMLVK